MLIREILQGIWRLFVLHSQLFINQNLKFYFFVKRKKVRIDCTATFNYEQHLYRHNNVNIKYLFNQIW